MTFSEEFTNGLLLQLKSIYINDTNELFNLIEAMFIEDALLLLPETAVQK